MQQNKNGCFEKKVGSQKWLWKRKWDQIKMLKEEKYGRGNELF